MNLRPLLVLALLPAAAFGQSSPQAQVEAAENAFWQAYNNCDYKVMDERVADDVEFFHDMGGVLKGRAAVVDAVRKNICGNPQHKVRREGQPAELKSSVLKQGNEVYGVFVTGTHLFHARNGANAEMPEGRARYAHLWLQKAPGQWKLARVFSYEHQPYGAAPAVAEAKGSLSAEQIDRYVGEFTGPGMPPLAFARTNGELTVAFEGKKLVLHPLAKAHTFLVRENNAEVEFAAGASGPATGVVVRMNGTPIGEAKRK